MQMSGRVEARECASAVRNPREAVCIASGSLSLSRCNSKRVEAVVRWVGNPGPGRASKFVACQSTVSLVYSSNAVSDGTLNITERKRKILS